LRLPRGPAPSEDERDATRTGSSVLACARGEAPVTCLPGFFSVQNRPPCFKMCKTNAECPKGLVCAPTGVDGLNYCIAD
jgi:hypothetical protein